MNSGPEPDATRPVVRVTHRFAAPPERIFDAWLDPKWIGRWMFGPILREETVLHIQTDPRVGGSFSFKVRRQGQEIDHVGTYRKIERPRRLSFTWGVVGESEDEGLVTVGIVPKENGSELTLTHEMDPKWGEFAKRTEESWAKMLGVLDRALSKETG